MEAKVASVVSKLGDLWDIVTLAAAAETAVAAGGGSGKRRTLT